MYELQSLHISSFLFPRLTEAKLSRVSQTDTVQLNSKVTFANVWNVCRMHLRHARDISEMHTRRVHASAKPRNKKYVSTTPLFPDVGRIQNVCGMCLGHVWMLPWSWAVLYVLPLEMKPSKQCINFQRPSYIDRDGNFQEIHFITY